MNIFSHYIWESEGEKANPSSVVLQQIKVRKKSCILVFICDGKKEGDMGIYKAGRFAESLVEWFHHRCIPVFVEVHGRYASDSKAETVWNKLQRELEKELLQNLTCYEFSGMLLWEEHFFYFAKGETKGYLFNKRFNKKQCRDLKEVLFGRDAGEALLMISGELQKGVSLLISTAGYCEYISDEEMVEVLFSEKENELRICKKLKELWKEDMARGGEWYVGAVFIRTE